MLLSITSWGQRQFTEGLIVTNSGDTISGFIEQRERDATINPSFVNFKSSMDGEVKSYAVEDVSYFSAKGIASYRRFTVRISMDPVELRDVMGYTIPEPQVKPVFLKILQEGNTVSLYAFKDELKIRFYVLENGKDKPEELVYRLVKVTTVYKEGFEFRNTLKFIADRAGMLSHKLEFEIERCPYQNEPILKIISAINGIKPPTVHMKSDVSGFHIEAGSGLSRAIPHGSSEFVKNAKGSPAAVIWGAVGYDLAINPYVGGVVIRTDLVYSAADLEMTTHDYRYSTSNLDLDHKFKQTSVSVGIALLAFVHNMPNVQIFISGGLVVNHSSYENDFQYSRTNKDTQESQLLALNDEADELPKQVWLYFPIGAGISFHRKLEINTSYSLLGMAMNQGQYLYKYTIGTFRGGVCYHF